MSTPTIDEAGQVPLSLREIVRDYGVHALDDPTLLGSLLPDLLAGASREARIVLAAASAGTARLLTEGISRGLPIDAAIRDVSVRLAAESMLDETVCRWIVATYAEALGQPAGQTTVVVTAQSPPTVRLEPPPLAGTRIEPHPISAPPAAVDAVATETVATSWPSRYALSGAALVATSLATVILIAKADVRVGSDFGLAALWWVTAFTPLGLAVFVKARQAGTWRDTAWALLVIAASFAVIVQAADQHRHYISSLGLAASDAIAVALLGFRWLHRAENRWARVAAALVAALATWLFQRSQTWVFDYPSADNWLRTLGQSLIIPAFLIAASVLSWAVSRRWAGLSPS